MKVLRGELDGRGLRIGVVVSRFNEWITRRLLEGAVDTLVRHGVSRRGITVVWVPGAHEIPFAVEGLTRRKGRVDAVVCLGAVIRGDTAHDEVVVGASVRGAMLAGLRAGVPVATGVLTAPSMEAALARAGGKAGHRGRDAAVAAVEMARLMRRLTR